LRSTLLFSALLSISILEVCAQQPPEFFEYGTSQIDVSDICSTGEIRVFRGELEDAGLADTKASIIGEMQQEGDQIFFKPLLPFDLETPYTLVCDGRLVPFKILTPGEHQIMEVVDIFPSTTQVPTNILKWYVRFSRPVNPVKIYDHIQFLDERGDPIDRSILTLAAPLLSDDGTLLTIWVEPGRQKQLLGPNHRLGGVFQVDQEYTLHIDASLKDAEGVPVSKEVRHEFSTIEPDRVKPSMEEWKVSRIQANTQEPLVIKSDDQLDYGSLIDALSLLYQGSIVEGTISYNSQTSTIYFNPSENWEEGNYTIQLRYLLEDLAGNNLHHLFDRPIDSDDRSSAELDLTISVQSY